MASIASSDILALFTTPTLTPIASPSIDPTYATIKTAQRELSANASSIHTNEGGGLHGHLALTVTPKVYLLLAGMPFDPPVNPPPNPIHLEGATAAQITEANRLHAAAVRTFQLYHNTDKALVRQLIAATPQYYITELCDDIVGYANVTCLELLTFLYTKYGIISQSELDNNTKRMSIAWNPPTPITALWEQLNTGMRFAEAGNDPLSDAHVYRLAYNLISSTGLFIIPCREWRMLPTEGKTYASLRAHFEVADRDRKLTLTTETAGFQGAANQSTIISTTPSPATLEDIRTEMSALRFALAAAITTPPAATTAPAANPVPVLRGYCWTHGSSRNVHHTSATCNAKAEGHQDLATATNKMGGSTQVWRSRPRRVIE
jgi:hypothetical protein